MELFRLLLILGLRLGEDRTPVAVAVVEAAGDGAGQFEVGQLVPADRDQRALAEQDVGGLVHGVGEHQAAHRGLPGVRDLVLDGGVALQLRDRDQAEEGQQQLVEGRDRAVREDRAAGGVDADGQIVQDQALHVLGQPLGDVPVGQYLVVGDDQEHLGAQVLQPDPVAKGAEVVAQVQSAGRPVPGQHPEPAGVPVDACFQGVGGGAVGDGRRGDHGFSWLLGGVVSRPDRPRPGKSRGAVHPNGPGHA
jgi:hypothetical protein